MTAASMQVDTVQMACAHIVRMIINAPIAQMLNINVQLHPNFWQILANQLHVQQSMKQEHLALEMITVMSTVEQRKYAVIHVLQQTTAQEISTIVATFVNLKPICVLQNVRLMLIARILSKLVSLLVRNLTSQLMAQLTLLAHAILLLALRILIATKEPKHAIQAINVRLTSVTFTLIVVKTQICSVKEVFAQFATIQLLKPHVL
jgi:hypothetical protein